MFESEKFCAHEWFGGRMRDGQYTYCDAEKAVDDGTYKSLSDDVLREFYKLLVNVSGVNPIAIDRIREKGRIIQEELSRREKLGENPQISLADEEFSSEETDESSANTSQRSWDQGRLNSLICDGIEESAELEYKSSAALSREDLAISQITKDVSAFANSAGGVLIYGIAESKDPLRKHLPERIDPVDRNSFSKEWLENIASQIRPRIFGLKIFPVQLDTAPNHLAYVVEIPSGATAHQARDYRYYRRFDFQSVPMPDHEIRDVMNRRGHPRISVRARLVLYPHPNREGKSGALIFDLANTSDVFARYFALSVHAPLKVRGNFILFDDAVLDNVGGSVAFRLNYSNHFGPPLFPRMKQSKSFPFRLATPMGTEPREQIDDIRWRVFADSMPAKSGSFTVEAITQLHQPLM